jgi:hypothetical protein
MRVNSRAILLEVIKVAILVILITWIQGEVIEQQFGRSLTVGVEEELFLVDPSGTVTPFARGPGGYHEDPGFETYLAMSRGGHVGAAECDFTPDDTFILRADSFAVLSPTGPGRNSFRLKSNNQYTTHVAV